MFRRDGELLAMIPCLVLGVALVFYAIAVAPRARDCERVHYDGPNGVFDIGDRCR